MSSFLGTKLVGCLVLTTSLLTASAAHATSKPQGAKVALVKRLTIREARKAGRLRTPAPTTLRAAPIYSQFFGHLAGFKLATPNGDVEYKIEAQFQDDKLLIARDDKTGVLGAFVHQVGEGGAITVHAARGTFLVKKPAIDTGLAERKAYVVSNGQAYRTLGIPQAIDARESLILATAESDTPFGFNRPAKHQRIAVFKQLPNGAVRRLSTRDLRTFLTTRPPLANLKPTGSVRVSGNVVTDHRFSLQVEGAEIRFNDVFTGGFPFRGDPGTILFKMEGGHAAWKQKSVQAIAEAMSKLSPVAMQFIKNISAGAIGPSGVNNLESVEVAIDTTGRNRFDPISRKTSRGQTKLQFFTNAKGELPSTVPMRLEAYALGTIAFLYLDQRAMGVALALDAATTEMPKIQKLEEIHRDLVDQWLRDPAVFATSNPYYKQFLEASFR